MSLILSSCFSVTLEHFFLWSIDNQVFIESLLCTQSRAGWCGKSQLKGRVNNMVSGLLGGLFSLPQTPSKCLLQLWALLNSNLPLEMSWFKSKLDVTLKYRYSVDKSQSWISISHLGLCANRFPERRGEERELGHSTTLQGLIQKLQLGSPQMQAAPTDLHLWALTSGFQDK